jgi:hypothetical protein
MSEYIETLIEKRMTKSEKSSDELSIKGGSSVSLVQIDNEENGTGYEIFRNSLEPGAS